MPAEQLVVEVGVAGAGEIAGGAAGGVGFVLGGLAAEVLSRGGDDDDGGLVVEGVEEELVPGAAAHSPAAGSDLPVAAAGGVGGECRAGRRCRPS